MKQTLQYSIRAASDIQTDMIRTSSTLTAPPAEELQKPLGGMGKLRAYRTCKVSTTEQVINTKKTG
jgi:hypothetical protein